MRLGVAAAVVGGNIVAGDVEIDDGVIVGVGLEPGASGLAIPGLIDLQVNGYAGIDVSAADPAAIVELSRRLARDGVLWFQPTIITAAIDRMREALTQIGHVAGESQPGCARIVGAHLEGPFLSATKPGIHELAHLRNPSVELLDQLLRAPCPVTMVTLAPELGGALDVVEELVRRRVVVSLGHSEAEATAAHAAFDRGARSVTHVFNAMRAFHHRDPGIAGAALARDDVIVMLIADGVHVHDDAIQLVWRAARRRLVLVSDAISAATLGDGVYELGAVDITVSNGVSRRWDGTLAGGVASLAAGMRRLVELGVPLLDAIDSVTRTPARLLGRPELGVLRSGGVADLVVLNDDLTVRTAFVAGRPASP